MISKRQANKPAEESAMEGQALSAGAPPTLTYITSCLLDLKNREIISGKEKIGALILSSNKAKRL